MGIIDGFEGCIGCKVSPSSSGAGDFFETGERIDGYGMGSSRRAEIAQLSLTGCGNEEAECHGESVKERE